MGYGGIPPLLTSGAGLDKAGIGLVGPLGPRGVSTVPEGFMVVVVVVVVVFEEPLLEL